LDPSAKITKTKASPEDKPPNFGLACLCTPSLASYVVTASSSSWNEFCAIANRAAKCTPKSTRADWNPVVQAGRDLLELCPDDYQMHYYSVDEFLAKTSISTANKRAIREEYESFSGCESAIPPLRMIGGREPICDCFTKKDKDPPGFRSRCISGQHPLVTAYTGPFVASCQEWLEKVFGGCCSNTDTLEGIFVAAGKTPEQLNLWRRSVPSGSSIKATDQTNFDSLQKEGAVDSIMALYAHLLRKFPHPNARFIMRLLRFQKLDMKGRTAKGWFWGVKGGQKSGASDTCMSNTWNSMVTTMYACSIASGVAVKLLVATGFRFAFMGDDTLFSVPPNVPFSDTLFINTMKDLGMDVKFETASAKAEVFLNMVPVPVGGGVYPTPVRVNWDCDSCRPEKSKTEVAYVSKHAPADLRVSNDAASYTPNTLTPEQFAALPAVENGVLRIPSECVFTPLVGRGFSRLFWTLSQPKSHISHIHSVVECMLPAVAHHPLWCVWLLRLWSLTLSTAKATNVAADLNLKYKILYRTTHPTSPEVGVWLCERYGTDPSELASCLAYLASVELGTILDHPLIEKVTSVDWRPITF